MRIKFFGFVVANCLLMALLSSCGQNGPLYLPTPDQELQKNKPRVAQ